jgi:AcrR family transcriptional regulator
MTVKKRVRRSPEEAKDLILSAAEKRMVEAGPEGLQVKEIATVAGVTHSTVLHHFGSAEGLRGALAEKMVEKLLSDMLHILDTTGNVVPSDHTILFRAFEVLSDDGHARLLAWAMLKGLELEQGRDTLSNLFTRLIESIAVSIVNASEGDISKESAERQARFTIFQAALTAIGDGVAGGYVADLIGLSNKEATKDFRDWFGGRLLPLDR